MSKLQLTVVLDAVGKAAAVFKNTGKEAKALAATLSASRKAMKDLNATQSSLDSFKKLKGQTGDLAVSLKSTNTRLKEIRAQMDAAATPSAKLSREHDRLAKKAQTIVDKYSKLKVGLIAQREALEKAGYSAKNLTQSQEHIAAQAGRVTAAINKESQALDKLNVIQDKINKNKASLQHSQQLAGKMRGAGVGMMGAGAVTAAPVIAAAKSYTDFETAMLGVARQVEGAKDDNGKYTQTYYEMGKAIQSLSERLPLTANEMAAIVEGGARMGIQGKENLLKFAETTAVMASAFDLPVDSVGNDIGQLSNLYKIPIDNIKELGDTINWLDDGALSQGGDIIEVMKRVAGAADFAKMSYKDAAALGSAFLSLGSGAEVAASATNAMIRELSVATMQGKKFQTGLKMIGVNAKQLQKDMNKDATGTILKIMDSIRKLPGEKQLEAATRLFGKQFGDDAGKLATNLDEFRRQLKLVNEEAAQGSMQRESDTRNATIGAMLTMSKNAVTNVFTDLGETMRPELAAILAYISIVAQGFRTWSQENPRLAATLVSVIKWLAIGLTVLGALTLALGTILVPLAIMKYSLVVLGIKASGVFGVLGIGIKALGRAFLMNPIGLVITGIALAAYLIYKYWEPITGFFVGLWGQVKQAFDGGISGVAALVLNWGPLGLFYKAFAAVMKYFGFDLPEKFTGFGSMIIDGLVTGITNKVEAAKNAIGSAGEAIVGFFKSKLGIKSPSRVFAQMGGFVNEGLAIGLSDISAPLNAVKKMTQGLAAAGAIGLSGALAAQPALHMPSDIPALDMRPPLMAGAARNAQPAVNQTITINVYAAPGMDARALSAEVKRQFETDSSGMNASLLDRD